MQWNEVEWDWNGQQQQEKAEEKNEGKIKIDFSYIKNKIVGCTMLSSEVLIRLNKLDGKNVVEKSEYEIEGPINIWKVLISLKTFFFLSLPLV